jgi:hypothetical protein
VLLIRDRQDLALWLVGHRASCSRLSCDPAGRTTSPHRPEGMNGAGSSIIRTG